MNATERLGLDRRSLAYEALRQAVNMRLAGEVIIRSDAGPADAQTIVRDREHLALGTVTIIVTDAEVANGHLTSADLVTKLLTVTNPHAVGM